ncbi:flavodoxin FldA [Gilliamella sp. CG22]|uniref:flavodoxin FldA n=1 Tax=Gilliamella sp. CG22 TaxID=3351504 RepID=UPI003985DBA6
MKQVGIFFGSDTGNTENVAKQIQLILGNDKADLLDIREATKEHIEQYAYLIFGIPTWYYGDPQADWEDFFPNLEQIDFDGKTVAIFGCGDQEDYSEFFCSAMGTIRDIIEPKGAKIVGHWPTEGYNFEASKGLVDDTHFVGLAIDEDRQPELTEERISTWVEQVKTEMNI